MNITRIKCKKLYEVIYSAALCAGCLLLLREAAAVFYPGAEDFLPHSLAVVPVSFLCLLAIYWVEERKLRVPVWTGAGLFLAVSCILLYRYSKDMYLSSGGKTETDGFLTRWEIYLLSAAGGSTAEALPITGEAEASRLSIYLVLFILILTAAVLLCGVLSYLARNRVWLKAAVMLIQGVCLFTFVIREYEVTKALGCIFLFCLLLLWTEGTGWLKLRFQTRKAAELQSAIYLLPVFLAAVLFITLIPVKETPFKWTLVHNAANMIEEMVNDLSLRISLFFSREGGSYTMSFAGFGGDGSVKGGLASSGLTQITLEGSRTKSPLYITGTVYDSYTGNGWEVNGQSRPYEGEEYVLNIEEFNKALTQSSYTQEEILSVVRSCRFELAFEGIKTDTVFQAPLTSNFYFEQRIPYEAASDSIIMDKAKSIGFHYAFACLDVDWASSEIKALLRQEAWKQTPEPDSLFSERQKFIHENYTALPDSVPRRVYELTEEITGGLTSDYDKLKAIESWLCSLSYSTMPESCPEGQDLADFFLFDSREGYCTYFATAMAVMGRCAGIPTRYVEGFVTNDSRRYEGKLIELKGDNAHAWAECYLDNIGWIVFESTPGYYDAANTAWLRMTPGTADEMRPEVEAIEPQEEEPPDLTLEQQEEAKEDKGWYPAGILGVAVLLLLGLVCLFVILILLRNMLRRRKYLVLDERERMTALMKKILQFGELSGYSLEKGETLSAYEHRTEGCLNTPEMTFKQVCSLYQSIRFGGETATKEQVKQLESYRRTLEKQYLSQCGRMRRLLYYLV